jgi:dihydrofolate reductase
MRTVVYIAASLDGYIARKDGSIDWLTGIENPPGEDYGYAEFIKGIDAIVMGRNSFEKVLTFPEWPYPKMVFVLSTKLNDIPAELKIRASIISGSPADVLNILSNKGYNNIYVDGGKTIQGFLQKDLIDDMIITRIPILIGNGIPLFGDLEKDLSFDQLSTNVYPNGLVKTHYKRIRQT